MCGIAGLLGPDPFEMLVARVRAATDALAHRGPDGEGCFVQPPASSVATILSPAGTAALPAIASPATLGLAIGHRRLAILDRSTAAGQPMASASGRFVLALNGEIYNYVELRQTLTGAGVRFRTSSDTEVLVEGYAQWGDEVFVRAVGMFAVAVVDRREHCLVLARDPFGMKPLYYATTGERVAFASEPDAVLDLIGLERRVDLHGLADYLASGHTDHRDGTLFAGVQAVPSASVVRISTDTAATTRGARYWTPEIGEPDDRPVPVIARDLRDRFLRSVELHLRSDVPVGALLSGGLDSSAIVMAMREVGGARLDIPTFSYVPDDDTVSEASWIAEVNAAAGATGQVVRLSREAWESDAPALMRRQGEPFGSPAVYAQSELFRVAASHGVRVILDGQGADEVFGGYRSFRAARFAAGLRRGDVAGAWRFLRGLGPRAGWRDAVASRQTFELVCPGVCRRPLERLLRRPSLVDDAWFRRHGVAAPDPGRAWPRRLLQARLLHAVCHEGLPALLRFTDRSAMRHGVESRLPFLTRELVEFALRLPDHLVVADDGRGKAILRDALRGLVPASVLDRRDKIGFALPLRPWLLQSPHARAMERTARALPGVDPRPAGGDDPRSLFLRWRLVGLGQWVATHAPQFPE